jgi:putative membrane protein
MIDRLRSTGNRNPNRDGAASETPRQFGTLRIFVNVTPNGHAVVRKDAPMLSDPRVFFAAERTLLAWVRTGLTIMAFGFVVARFGLFLRLLAVQHVPGSTATQTSHDLSNIAGIGLVVLGIGCMILGAIQHRSYVRTLPPQDIPRSHAAIYPIALALFLAALGVVLAIYLAMG